MYVYIYICTYIYIYIDIDIERERYCRHILWSYNSIGYVILYQYSAPLWHTALFLLGHQAGAAEVVQND